MAGDPGLRFEWHLSGGISNNVAANSLGGTLSNFRMDALRTTVAANAAAGATRITLASVSAGSSNAILSFRNGNAGGFFTRIIGDSGPGPGWVDLLDPIPDSVAISDGVEEFRAIDVSMPWGTTTNQQSADGFVQSIGGFLVCTGGTFSGVGAHIEEINPGTVTHEIAFSNATGVSPFPTKASLEADPDLSQLMSGSTPGAFVRPLVQATKTPLPNLSGFQAVRFWLRRTVLPDSVRQSDQTTAIVITDNASLEARLVLHWNTPGFTPDLALVQSPSIYTGGGARFRANLKSAESGLPVEGIPVAMRLVSGPGTFYPPADPGETDDDGNVIGHYTATTEPGDVGSTVTVEAEV